VPEAWKWLTAVQGYETFQRHDLVRLITLACFEEAKKTGENITCEHEPPSLLSDHIIAGDSIALISTNVNMSIHSNDEEENGDHLGGRSIKLSVMTTPALPMNRMEN